MIDALNTLIADYGGTDNFIEKVVYSTLFFPRQMVRHRMDEMRARIEQGLKLFVRYSSSGFTGAVNRDDAGRKTKAQRIALDSSVGSKMVIYIQTDKDGNCENRRLLKAYTGHLVSGGAQSTLRNYIISHVWGQATHPLFFTSLWNIVLMPVHFNFLMDKSDDFHPVVKIIKNRIKAQCVRLYEPYTSFLAAYDIDGALATIVESGKADGHRKVHFIEKAKSSERRSLTGGELAALDRLLKSIGKRFFIENFRSMSEGVAIDYFALMQQYRYTLKALYSRIGKMRRIIRDGTGVLALRKCVDSMKLDEGTRANAVEMLRDYAL